MIPDAKTFRDFSHIGHVESWLDSMPEWKPLPAWAYAGMEGGLYRHTYCDMYKEAA